jgi:hypothetical protein
VQVWKLVMLANPLFTLPTQKHELCNILYVPKATKSLISIHHFTLDNNILFKDVMMPGTPYQRHHTPTSFHLELISHLSLDGMIV